MATERPERERNGLKANAELRKALDEAERCMSFFEEGKFIEYLQSLNEIYLQNKGSIQGPSLTVSTRIDNVLTEDQTLLELNNTYGGISTSLKWKDIEEYVEIEKLISLDLTYNSSSDYFSLSIFTGVENRFGTENSSGLLNTGTSLQRNFMLNPEPKLNTHVDDLLLTFTNELFDAGIL